MVEGRDAALVRRWAEDIAAAVEARSSRKTHRCARGEPMKKIVLGNWKSLGDTASNAVLLAALAAHPPAAGVEVGVCVPFPFLPRRGRCWRARRSAGGRRTSAPLAPGPIPEKCTPECLPNSAVATPSWDIRSGVSFLPRRTNGLLIKSNRLLAANVRPVVCVGETLAEREAGGWRETLGRQVAALAARLGPEKLSRAWFAYEPVWAIGTGRVAAPRHRRGARLLA